MATALNLLANWGVATPVSSAQSVASIKGKSASANQRGQKVTEVGGNIFQVGQGKDARFIRGSVTGSCGALLTTLQADKVATARLLRLHGLPTVEHRRVYNEAQALIAADELRYPVVIKPFNGARGRNVVCDIRSPEELRTQLAALNTLLDSMLVERQVEGDAFRFLLVNQQFGYCSRRATPSSQVTGSEPSLR